MSAVRVVAYGVLELKRVDPPAFKSNDDDTLGKYQKQMFEFDQLMKLVKDELKRAGMLLTPKVGQQRTRQGHYVLHGGLINAGFPARDFLYEGSFKDCCVVAAQLLDEAETPPTADGLTFSGNPQE